MYYTNMGLHILFKRVFLIVILFCLAIAAQAQTRVHEVKKGETLTSIAQEYQMTAGELRALNKLQNERIEVGQKLKVRDVEPVSLSTSQPTSGIGVDVNKLPSNARPDSARTTTTTILTRTAETPRQQDTLKLQEAENIATSEPTVRVEERTHIVKSGETLFNIASTYSMSLADLKKLNGIVGNDVAAGQRLRVFTTVIVGPEPQDNVAVETEVRADTIVREQPERTPPPVSENRNTDVSGKTQAFNVDIHEWYMVRSTDTLPGIARTFKMSIAQLRELNGSMIYTMNEGDQIVVLKKTVASSTNSVRVERQSEEAAEAKPPVVPPQTNTQPPRESTPPVETSPPPTVEQRQTEEQAQTEDVAVSESDNPDSGMYSDFVQRGRFIGHVVKRNERLATILETYLMDESDFYALNPTLDGRPPRTGTEVLVFEPPSNIQPNPYAITDAMDGLSRNELVSNYTSEERGKLTSSGELYNPEQLTAAHSQYPLGSILYVTNPTTGRGTYVRVNDRTDKAGILLSDSAIRALGLDASRTEYVLVSKE